MYPKEPITSHYELKFKKVDKDNPDTTLQGAVFEITNGKKYAVITGFSEHKEYTGTRQTPVDVSWTDSEDQATYFKSGADGLFGFTAYPEIKSGDEITGIDPNGQYGFSEVTAPTGYNKDATLKDNPTSNTVSPTEVKASDADADSSAKTNVITDTPEGILPHTGGAGIVLYVVLGAALVILGTIAYKKRRAN